MNRALIWSLLLIAAALALATMVVGHLQSPMRALLTFSFFLVGPGMAFVLWLRIADWITELTLAVALSLALTTLTSEAMIYTGAWSPEWSALWLLGWTVVSLAAYLIRTYLVGVNTRGNL